jgi:hypothetical protein
MHHGSLIARIPGPAYKYILPSALVHCSFTEVWFLRLSTVHTANGDARTTVAAGCNDGPSAPATRHCWAPTIDLQGSPKQMEGNRLSHQQPPAETVRFGAVEKE